VIGSRDFGFFKSMDTASTASPASIAYFDRVPNEVLHLILSFVAFPPDDLQPCGDPENGVWILPVFVLRWVSRRFRMISNQLEAWREIDISNELSCTFGRNSLEEAQYLRILLRDDALADNLGRKSRWDFENIDVFFVVTATIPEVTKNTKAVTLWEFRDGLGVAIDRLGMFTCLTELIIRITWDERSEIINLDLIEMACPLLEGLKFIDLLKYSGTLSRMDTLKALNIHFSRQVSYEAFGSPSLDQLVPSGSKNSLTAFFISLKHFDRGSFEYRNFDRFLNLKQLGVSVLNRDFCRIITEATFNLTSLVLSCSHRSVEHLPDLIAMLSAPSLRFLENLNFTLLARKFPDASTHDDWGDTIISGIVRLQQLQTLTLDMGLCRSWCEHFAQLKNLKCLVYNYIDLNLHDLYSRMERGDFLPLLDNARPLLVRLFDDAFKDSLSKPHVRLYMNRLYFT
jgi:hypothetical protein